MKLKGDRFVVTFFSFKETLICFSRGIGIVLFVPSIKLAWIKIPGSHRFIQRTGKRVIVPNLALVEMKLAN